MVDQQNVLRNVDEAQKRDRYYPNKQSDRLFVQNRHFSPQTFVSANKSLKNHKRVVSAKSYLNLGYSPE